MPNYHPLMSYAAQVVLNARMEEQMPRETYVVMVTDHRDKNKEEVFVINDCPRHDMAYVTALTHYAERRGITTEDAEDPERFFWQVFEPSESAECRATILKSDY